MRRHARGTWLARLVFAASSAATIAIVACGARTGLPVDHFDKDAGVDAPKDAPKDVPADVPPDVPPDAPPVVNCEEAGITYIYVITSQNDLYAFYPPDLSFSMIGTIACPAGNGATPFSMAVDRGGTAYVLFNDGELFKVSTKDASCDTTTFTSNQNGFGTLFGMGYSSNKADPGETLYVADEPVADAGTHGGLATIDTQSFNLSFVGPFDQDIGSVELTGTGDARLFAFGPESNAPSHLAEIDKTSGKIISDTLLTLPTPMLNAWAFAFWGGDFYFFTGDTTNGTVVSRYTPGGTTTLPTVASLADTVVGAGVSTCSPH